MPEDTPEITKAKEEKAKVRKEKIDKDKEERKQKLKNGDSDPGELQMCVIYHPFLWLQSFLSGYMSEVEGKEESLPRIHLLPFFLYILSLPFIYLIGR